jgi:hypothetical protein
MELRILPKIVLWILLLMSSLGAISFWRMPEPSSLNTDVNTMLEQQMAISAATNFAREWMSWNAEESPEDRLQRLEPYVDPSVVPRASQMKALEKGKKQQIVASEFLRLEQKNRPFYSVRVRVVGLNPERTVWEMDVSVWADRDKGTSVTAPPIIRPGSEPPTHPLPADVDSEPSVSNEIKQRMKPIIESFLNAYCEGMERASLVNYVTTESSLTPLQGRIQLVTVDGMKVTGSGPYTVNVSFQVEDPITHMIIPQRWSLIVIEENQKFFVKSIE